MKISGKIVTGVFHKRPNRFLALVKIDAEFGKALRQAAAEGVEVYAYSSEFIENEIILRDKVKIDLAL